MKLLDVVHPAAKTLVDISLSQDAEVCHIPLPPTSHLHSLPHSPITPLTPSFTPTPLTLSSLTSFILLLWVVSISVSLLCLHGLLPVSVGCQCVGWGGIGGGRCKKETVSLCGGVRVCESVCIS